MNLIDDVEPQRIEPETVSGRKDGGKSVRTILTLDLDFVLGYNKTESRSIRLLARAGLPADVMSPENEQHWLRCPAREASLANGGKRKEIEECEKYPR